MQRYEKTLFLTYDLHKYHQTKNNLLFLLVIEAYKRKKYELQLTGKDRDHRRKQQGIG